MEDSLDIKVQEKLMAYLAQRDHSPKELKTKLSKRFEPEDCDRAISWAKERGWILPEEELAQKVYRRLSERGKGLFYIQSYLKEKGLPPVTGDLNLEYEKAIQQLGKKYATIDGDNFVEKQKALAFLCRRGFSLDIARDALEAFLSNLKNEN